jgi:hypothetical protein
LLEAQQHIALEHFEIDDAVKEHGLEDADDAVDELFVVPNRGRRDN